MHGSGSGVLLAGLYRIRLSGTSSASRPKNDPDQRTTMPRSTSTISCDKFGHCEMPQPPAPDNYTSPYSSTLRKAANKPQHLRGNRVIFPRRKCLLVQIMATSRIWPNIRTTTTSTPTQIASPNLLSLLSQKGASSSAQAQPPTSPKDVDRPKVDLKGPFDQQSEQDRRSDDRDRAGKSDRSGDRKNRDAAADRDRRKDHSTREGTDRERDQHRSERAVGERSDRDRTSKDKERTKDSSKHKNHSDKDKERTKDSSKHKNPPSKSKSDRKSGEESKDRRNRGREKVDKVSKMSPFDIPDHEPVVPAGMKASSSHAGEKNSHTNTYLHPGGAAAADSAGPRADKNSHNEQKGTTTTSKDHRSKQSPSLGPASAAASSLAGSAVSSPAAGPSVPPSELALSELELAPSSERAPSELSSIASVDALADPAAAAKAAEKKAEEKERKEKSRKEFIQNMLDTARERLTFFSKAVDAYEATTKKADPSAKTGLDDADKHKREVATARDNVGSMVLHSRTYKVRIASGREPEKEVCYGHTSSSKTLFRRIRRATATTTVRLVAPSVDRGWCSIAMYRRNMIMIPRRHINAINNPHDPCSTQFHEKMEKIRLNAGKSIRFGEWASAEAKGIDAEYKLIHDRSISLQEAWSKRQKEAR